MIGGAFGGPGGAAIGSSIGAGISRVTGMGDYKVEENTLVSNQGVPMFRQGARSVRIAHRDFLGDVTGSTSFAIKNYPINPGLNLTFPWLASVAGQFQTYKIHGMLFEFKSTSANALNNVNSALGTVILATQYNSMLGNFASKLEMENYEFASSCKPADSCLHAIECAQGESPLECLYIRSGAVPVDQDQRFFDFAEFQIATVGMQAASTIGELWVTYDIELFKPRIIPGGVMPGQFFRLNNGPFDVNNVLGSIQTLSKGNLGPLTITATGAGFDTINWPATISGGKFAVMIAWRGSVQANCVMPTLVATNATFVQEWCINSQNNVNAPVGGTANSLRMVMFFTVTVDGYAATGAKIVLSAGVYPTTPTFVDIFVVSVPTSDVFV